MSDATTHTKLFNGDEKEKLKQLVREGIQVMREMDSLKEPGQGIRGQTRRSQEGHQDCLQG